MEKAQCQCGWVAPSLLVSSTLDRFVLTWAFLVASCGFCSSWSLLTIRYFKELSWHRNLRVKRKRARVLLRQRWLPPGISTKRITRAIQLLQHHHGSHVPRFHKMESTGWNCPCQPSGAKNGANRSYCSSCGTHYTLVKWWPMTQSRGRSASKRRRDRRQPKTSNGGKDEPLNLPVSALKQALLEKGVQDPEILAKLAVIEKSTSDSAPTTITHKTVNQLKKAEKAFESTLAQIKELDEKWKIFSESLKTKFSEQGALYKAKRKQLVAKNMETKEKIGLLRQEIQKAAINPEVEEIPEEILEEPDLGEMKIDLTLASDSEEDARSRSRPRNPPSKAAKLEAKTESMANKPWDPVLPHWSLQFCMTRRLRSNTWISQHRFWDCAAGRTNLGLFCMVAIFWTDLPMLSFRSSWQLKLRWAFPMTWIPFEYLGRSNLCLFFLPIYLMVITWLAYFLNYLMVILRLVFILDYFMVIPRLVYILDYFMVIPWLVFILDYFTVIPWLVYILDYVMVIPWLVFIQDSLMLTLWMDNFLLHPMVMLQNLIYLRFHLLDYLDDRVVLEVYRQLAAHTCKLASLLTSTCKPANIYLSKLISLLSWCTALEKLPIYLHVQSIYIHVPDVKYRR